MYYSSSYSSIYRKIHIHTNGTVVVIVIYFFFLLLLLILISARWSSPPHFIHSYSIQFYFIQTIHRRKCVVYIWVELSLVSEQKIDSYQTWMLDHFYYVYILYTRTRWPLKCLWMFFFSSFCSFILFHSVSFRFKI